MNRRYERVVVRALRFGPRSGAAAVGVGADASAIVVREPTLKRQQVRFSADDLASYASFGQSASGHRAAGFLARVPPFKTHCKCIISEKKAAQSVAYNVRGERALLSSRLIAAHIPIARISRSNPL